MNQLSTLKRNEYIQKASTGIFDIIIIGGGITGAGIALDAASRGLKVLLLEKYDFSNGTSSKSTKLIHGGLRYLKQLEFGLVSHVGRERAIINKLAPHLVKPVNMLLPIYKNGSLGKFSTAIALWVYDLLANVNPDDKFKMLNNDKAILAEPLLNRNALEGAAIYKEYQTDDARLTIEVIKTAASYDAICLNYTQAEEFIYDDHPRKGKLVKGIIFRDLLNNKSLEVYAKKIINASGPWVDEIRRKDAAPGKKKLHLTKGIHIVVDKKRFPISNAIYFDAHDKKRMIFAIPRNETVYIGTTDTDYFGNKDMINVSKNDVDYLLNAVNEMFPAAILKTSDITSSWAGLRPLIHEEGKSPSELSRKDEIFISDSGLISIAGGKLTGYRKMAEKVVNLIVKEIKKQNDINYPPCKTKTIKLSGADFAIPIEEYIERRAGEASQIGLLASDIKRLVDIYGTGTEKIIEIAFENAKKFKNAGDRLLFAEIYYCAEYEMITNASDFLIRRTGRLYFDRPALLSQYKYVNDVIAEVLNLTDPEKQDHLLFLEQMIQITLNFEGYDQKF
ncbi:MAG: glycerol-3-phosphate dehydrogenase/oxidase [Chitinophagales bacterium]